MVKQSTRPFKLNPTFLTRRKAVFTWCFIIALICFRYILNGEKALSYNHTSEEWSAPAPTCEPLTCAQWSCLGTHYCSLVEDLPYCKLCEFSLQIVLLILRPMKKFRTGFFVLSFRNIIQLIKLYSLSCHCGPPFRT